MPPVQSTTSAPRPTIFRMAAVVIRSSSSVTSCPTTSVSYSWSFLSRIGVNESLIRPLYTSEPVVTIPILLWTNG